MLPLTYPYSRVVFHSLCVTSEGFRRSPRPLWGHEKQVAKSRRRERDALLAGDLYVLNVEFRMLYYWRPVDAHTDVFDVVCC
jgi:hypothetical protein